MDLITLKRNFLALAKYAARIAAEKKADNVALLNIQNVSSESNYALIASAGSSTQVNAIRQAIIQSFRDSHCLMPLYCDGRQSVHWCALDYGGLVIHIMSPQARAFYNLDKIYSDGRRLKF